MPLVDYTCHLRSLRTFYLKAISSFLKWICSSIYLLIYPKSYLSYSFDRFVVVSEVLGTINGHILFHGFVLLLAMIFGVGPPFLINPDTIIAQALVVFVMPTVRTEIVWLRPLFFNGSGDHFEEVGCFQVIYLKMDVLLDRLSLVSKTNLSNYFRLFLGIFPSRRCLVYKR